MLHSKELGDYQIIEEIFQNQKTTIYSAKNKKTNRYVIIKLYNEETLNYNEISRYVYEYTILKQLDIQGISKPIALEYTEGRPYLILEQFSTSSISLKNLIKHYSFDLKLFIRLSIQITKILIEIHKEGIIHKDIKPQNIIIDTEILAAKIIDFGFASKIKSERQDALNINSIEGTLFYISPEQTGRVNRQIDFRTDLYSLGITLYELFTGRLPFYSSDPLNLIHQHIAKQPSPPAFLNHKLPITLSNIILKLISKTPENRYLSAIGLLSDLEKLYTHLERNDFQISKFIDFQLAENDISDHFIVQGKLYEREKDIEDLENAFNQTLQGNPSAVFISGYSGIGKTSLVKEIQKKLLIKKAKFLGGRFDGYNLSIPYTGFISAFKDLVSNLVLEDESYLQSWKAEVIEKLGKNLSIIVEILPDLEQIFGKQEISDDIGLLERQYRFNNTFKNFIEIFCKEDSPLVLYLDDLQWADTSSLNLIKILITSKINSFFFITSYRDNEVNNAKIKHPLIKLKEELIESKISIQNISLGPLGKKSIERLILDSIQTTEDVTELAEIIHNKTSGNPFYVNQILKSFYDKKLIYFEYDNSSITQIISGKWKWNISAIKKESITNNVIDLMIQKIDSLSENTKHILMLASCLGNEFDLHTLSIINTKSYYKTSSSLWGAIQEGLIIPKGNVHMVINVLGETALPETIISHILKSSDQFLHDKVRMAAYSLLDENEKQETHLKIARLLYENSSLEERNLKIFEIVSNYNLGINFITDPLEKKLVFDLNYQAGEKAFSSQAYPTALEFFSQAMNLYKEDIWTIDSNLAIKLYLKSIENHSSLSNYDESEKIAESLLQKTNDPIIKSQIYSLLIKQYNITGEFQKATELAILGLRLLNVKLPENNLDKALQKEFEKAESYLDKRDISSLINEKIMNDDSKLATMLLLSSITSTAYLYNPSLYPIIVLKLVTHSLKYGNTSHSCFGYSTYGLILGAIHNDYKKGYEFGWLALNLAEKLNSSSQKCKSAFLFANYIHNWQKHIKDSEIINDEAFRTGIESGDSQFAGYSLVFKLFNPFFASHNLEHILQDSYSYYNYNYEVKNFWSCDLILSIQIIITNLISQTKSRSDFYYKDITENIFLENSNKHNSNSAKCVYYIFKAEVYFIYNEYDLSLKSLEKAREFLPSILGQIEVAEFYFYETLSLLQLYKEKDSNEKLVILNTINSNIQKISIWTENSPENFKCRLRLLNAELKRIQNLGIDCLHDYDDAITLAQRTGFKQIEAIAQELTGRFLIELNKGKLSSVYFKEAKFSYSFWGANRKVDLLNSEFPELQRSFSKLKSTGAPILSSSIKFEMLDISTALKASRIIASEIRLDNLLTKTIQILVENSSAEKGVLILKHEKADLFFVQAEHFVTQNETLVLESIPVEEADIPQQIVRYVIKTRDNLVISNAYKDQLFLKDPYVVQNKVKSILCTPFLHQGDLLGILYLENNTFTSAFTTERLELLHIIASQVVVSINNAFIYANLEREVDRRTVQLNESLVEIQNLKEQQDGDYFLTSLLIKPLSTNISSNKNLEIETFTRQKKQFIFKKYTEEIGGDICISDSIQLRSKSYTLFITADAMGKSIQGAGGALVLGAVLKAISERTKIDELVNYLYPERWLKNAFVELHRVFMSFDGMMLISGVFGIVENETGLVYYLNIESPLTVLYRNKKASLIHPTQTLRKLGSFGTENNEIIIQIFRLLENDSIINGSDGRDDLIIGMDSDGHHIINMNDSLFLQTVEESEADLEKCFEISAKKGNILDDFSLQKIKFTKRKYSFPETQIPLFEAIPNYVLEKNSEKKRNVLRKVFSEFYPTECNPYVLRWLGIEAIKLKDFPFALEVTKTYTEINSHANDMIYLEAIIHRLMKNFTLSLEVSDRLELREPSHIKNLENILICVIKLKKKGQIKKIIKKLFFFDTENKKAIKYSNKYSLNQL